MDIMQKLQEMKEIDLKTSLNPNLPMEKKRRGLKEVKKGVSNGNQPLKISNGNISKENRRKYIASLIGRRRK